MHDFAADIVNPGARRGILFLHGFLGDRDEFRHIGREFERTHTVVYADLPGHGQSFHDVAEQLSHLLHPPLEKGVGGFSQVSKTHWHVVGYSLGGRLALYIACRWPHLVSRLTLISSSPGLESQSERRARLLADQLLAQKMQNTAMRPFLNYWYRQPLFKEFRAHPAFNSLLQRRSSNDLQQLQKALVATSVGQQPSLWNELKHLSIPIDLVCGAKDQKFVDIARRMQAANPRMCVTVVAKAGHVVHWEAPQLVTKGIANGQY